MCNKTRLLTCLCAIVLGLGGQIYGQQETTGGTTRHELNDREKDGLIGPVRRVTVESAKIIIKNGNVTEAPRVLREVTTYDPRGKKVDTVAYPIDGETLPGKEQYKYDDKGNIVEMQLRSSDGRLLSKEFYKYQMDEVGNWKKMTASLAVFQEGQLSDEPVEVTYRTITYFYSQDIAKLVAAAPATGSNGPANLKESEGRQPAGDRKKTAIPAREPPVPTKSEPRFTNTLAANSAIPKADESKNTSSPKQTLLGSEAVPLSQKVSSASLTGLRPDPETVREPSTLSTERLPAKEERKSIESPSGVTVGNAVPAGARAANPPGTPVVNLSADPGNLYNLGVSYLESGKPREAVLTLKEAVHKNPENTVAYLKLGLAYSALRQYKEAIAAYKMAIQIRRDLVDAEAYYQLGQAYTGIGKHSDAVAALKQALYITRADAINSERQKTPTVPSMEELHYSLGLVYYQQTKYKEAVDELQKVIELNPRLAEAHFGLAVSYIALGDRRSAEKQQKVLASLNPALAKKIADALSGNKIMPPGVSEGILGGRRRN
jgi:tetratricopeptide (TPR) repeat protein